MPALPPSRYALALLALLAGCGDSQPFTRSSVGATVAGQIRTAPPGATTTATALPAPALRTPPETVVGSGSYAGAVRTTTAGQAGPDGISLNFVNADIRTVVQTVLGDLLGQNYTIDPGVQGTITLQTSSPVPRDSVLATLEEVLRLNGAALVRQPQGYRAIPADEARFAYGMTQVGTARGPGWRTQVVPLRFANAADLQQALGAMAGTGAAVRADPARNLIVMTGSGPEIANMLDTVAALDVDALSGQSFALHRLQVANPRALSAELGAIFQAAGDAIRFVPVQRINAMMVIARHPQGLRDAAGWIERLDRPGDTNEQQLFVYRVESGRAAYLAEMLGKLYPEHGVSRAGRERYPGSGERVGDSFGMRSEPRLGGALGSEPAMLAPVPGGGSGAFGVVGAAPAAAHAPPPADNDQPTDALRKDATAEGNAASGVRIIADTTNNAVVILARPAVYQQIEATLRKLDTMPAQVLIEATIAEVRLNDELRFGTQFFFRGNNNVRLTNDPLGTVLPQAPGLSYFFSTRNTQIVLDALKEITDVNVLSTPTVMVMDNQTAVLQVGDQVPIITSTAQSVLQPDAPVVNQISLRDTGVILSVTPRVTASSIVQLEVRQEVSDVVPTTSSTINSPTFQRRRLESAIAASDNETIALGGLIRTNRTRGRSGVPELADIPVVGALFGTRTDQVDRTELLVLITPRVIRNADESRAATEELRRRLSATPPPPKPAVLP